MNFPPFGLGRRLRSSAAGMRLTVSRAMIGFAFLFALGFAAVLGMSHFIFTQLKINGPVFDKIMLGKQLVADIQPPPVFTVEAYILAQQMNDGSESATNGKNRLAEMKRVYLARKEYWDKADIPEVLRGELNMVLIGNTFFWNELETSFIPALEKGDREAARSSFEKLSKTFNIHANKIHRLVEKANGYVKTVDEQAANATRFYETIMQATAAGVVLMVGGMLFWLHRRVVKAISAMAAYMKKLAADDYDADVPFAGRRDEIGDMAQAVSVFRAAGLEKRRLEAEADATRRDMDNERSAREAETLENQRAARMAVDVMGEGLNRLAEGDLIQRIEIPLSAGADQLRTDFNVSVEKLQQTLLGIHAAAGTIRRGLDEISIASDDLSRRSEQQAASLEETAAALGHITETVKKTADGASHASKAVADAKADAEESGTVVRQAIGAMEQIERSSREIGNIIGVIDEIAFQTNLLALNAGVEAARAGDAGRGFAVVASEVRGLAQRSAEAAKEIKQLIGASTAQVDAGVKLVAGTGTALQRITSQVNGINDIVAEIAAAANEQATGLREVNIAIGQMDETTQKNAALVEETTAASHSLAQESAQLVHLVNQFKVGANGNSPVPVGAAPSARHSPAPLLTRGGLAIKRGDPVAEIDGWDDF